MLGNPWMRLANNWVHDVGTGLWAACLLVLWVLRGRLDSIGDAAGAAFATTMSDVLTLVFWLLIGALVAIVVTGALRLAYWRAETPREQLPAKRPALIGKHVAFVVIYGVGTAWAWRLALVP